MVSAQVIIGAGATGQKFLHTLSARLAQSCDGDSQRQHAAGLQLLAPESPC